MRILLTNDDGWQATGILSLYQRLGQEHDVTLVAPDREKSAVSHGITLHTPLRITPLTLDGPGRAFCINGTPADCVKLGLSQLFPDPPDMLISGINPGANIGIDVHYSGTVSAAREGTMNGIPSLAASIRVGEVMDFPNMADYIVRLAQKVAETGLPAGTLLNINAPAVSLETLPQVKITSQSFDNISNKFAKATDPRNRDYFWYGGQADDDCRPGTDMHALENGCISITPIQCDITNHPVMKELESLTGNLNHTQPKPENDGANCARIDLR